VEGKKGFESRASGTALEDSHLFGEDLNYQLTMDTGKLIFNLVEFEVPIGITLGSVLSLSITGGTRYSCHVKKTVTTRQACPI